MRSDLRALRNERYNNRNAKIKEVKKLGELRRRRADRYRDHQDIFDYDPMEWLD